MFSYSYLVNEEFLYITVRGAQSTIKGTGPSVFFLFSAKRLKKKFGHFLVQKDWKKSWVIFWCKKIEKKVRSLFSAKRLKKKYGHFLVQKDWKKKKGHFLVQKDWKKK